MRSGFSQSRLHREGLSDTAVPASTTVPIAVPTVPTVIETCGLLAPFDDMDALRHFSNHVYVKYMGNCRRKEPPRDWV